MNSTEINIYIYHNTEVLLEILLLLSSEIDHLKIKEARYLLHEEFNNLR